MLVLKFLFLLILWLVFSGIYDVFHISFGVLSAAVVTYLTRDMVFKERLPLSKRLQEYLNFLVYAVWLLYQVLLANLYLLKIVFAANPRDYIKPVLVDLNVASLKGSFPRVVLAQSITLTPGTVTIKMEEDSLKIYCINNNLVSGLEDMLAKVKWVYGINNE